MVDGWGMGGGGVSDGLLFRSRESINFKCFIDDILSAIDD